MPLNSKVISLAKSILKDYLKDKEILDVILFGSAIKGKVMPKDIDIAIITEKNLKINKNGFHISILNPREFFIHPPTLINTLLREGFSLKHNKYFAENFRFVNRVLFKYDLISLSASNKVRIVNILRGKTGEKGLVEANNGEWLANQVFIALPENEHIFEKFLLNSAVKFKKIYTLMH